MRLCSVLLAVLVSISQVAGTEQKKIKIGAIIAQTGPLAVTGTTIKNAMILSQRENDPENRIKLVFEDDGFQPKNTVAAYQKLMLSESPAAVITFGSSTSMSIAPMMEQANIPLLALTIVDSLTTGGQYSFRYFISTKELNKQTVKDMQEARVKTVALLSTVQDGMLELRDHFRQSYGSGVVLSEEFLPGETDFRSTITRIKALKPDAIYFTFLPPQASLFAKQLRQLGFSPKLFGGIPASAPAEIARAEGAMNGALIATGDDRRAAAFYTNYAKNFPEKPFSEAAYAYDAVKLLIAASKSPNIHQYLLNVKNFSGVLGEYSADGNHSFTFATVTKAVSDSGITYKQ